jgi:branched-chain amino acid aminotransferase group I
MEPIVFLNGALVPRSGAGISAFDHGFLYGYGLFETMRAYSGRIFRLRQHLDRLAGSAAFLDIPLEGLDLGQACCDVLEANHLGDARVRLAVSMGAGEAAPDPPPHPEPTVLLVASEHTPIPQRRYEDGFKAIVSSIRQNSGSPVSRLKSASYLGNLLARREARAAGADEALLLNEHGCLCEGSSSNVFLVRAGGLHTPNEASGCLAGITRSAVVEVAAGLGIPVAQREVRLEELLEADEAFVTNSVVEVMPLTAVDGKRIGRGVQRARGSSITQRVMAAYRALVATETESPP